MTTRSNSGIAAQRHNTGVCQAGARPEVDRKLIRLVAELSAYEQLVSVCEQLAHTHPEMGEVGRRAASEMERCRHALHQAGLNVPAPDTQTAIFYGRSYRLPDVTAQAVRQVSRA